MSEEIAQLRSRLEHIRRCQFLLESGQAELEVQFLKMHLVEQQVINRCYSRQLEMFGCTEARTCELVRRFPLDRAATRPRSL